MAGRCPRKRGCPANQHFCRRQRLIEKGGGFPKLPEFQQVTLKVLRWEERDKRLVIKEAQMVA